MEILQIDKIKYEKDLLEKQETHLNEIQKKKQILWIPCLHNSCTECFGTGIKKDGSNCIHMISCPCPKCKPYSL